ncbi:DUF6976 family protein [Demequina sp. NBRC 110054]|uniref:DUF6976 family protein n=1 Tax=Demequina sp. NBRC 110054 TaxID=1570343 RepID=UPI000A00DCBE|nr:hypothetical protein [Demequina sp. NBRC 110054]
MTGTLHTLDEAVAKIATGVPLLIAGDEALLAQLPEGRWIGGTIPYFMTSDGGRTTRDLLHVDTLPSQVTDVAVRSYAADELSTLTDDAFETGFSIIIVPAGSEAHSRYAAEAADFPGLFDRPVVGWVAGVHLDDLASAEAKTFAGSGESANADRAVVLHAQLADGVLASADIVNLFQQGDGATLTFTKTGFSQDTVWVDGEPKVFSTYLEEIGHDTRLPLVADYFGAMINVSFQSVPEGGGAVDLYAPVFSGVEYRLASPVGDYVAEFNSHLPAGTVVPTFSCNCILNYLYSELEGKKTGDIVGPVTFGEIAYQLLNQTLVYLTIHE